MKHKCSGYFTIEATLIIPFIFMIMLWIIYIGLFQYNRAMLTQQLDSIAVLESSHYYLSNEEVHDNILLAKNSIEWDKLIGIENQTTQINVTSNKITIIVTANMIIPIKIPILLQKDWELEILIEAKRNNPTQILRRSQILKELKNGENKDYVEKRNN